MITIKDDLAKLEKKLGKMERGLIPKATSQAINKAVRSVNSAAVKEVSAETNIKQKEIRHAHQLYLSSRNRLRASIDAKKSRAKNLINFVRPSQRKAGRSINASGIASALSEFQSKVLAKFNEVKEEAGREINVVTV